MIERERGKVKYVYLADDAKNAVTQLNTPTTGNFKSQKPPPFMTTRHDSDLPKTSNDHLFKRESGGIAIDSSCDA